LLTELANKNVLVYPADATDCGVINYRINLPYTTLQRFSGCKLKISNSLDQQDIEMADVLVFNRQYNEACLKAAEYAMVRSRLVVFDLDDNIFGIQKDNQAYSTYTDPNVLHNMQIFLEHAHVVTVTSDRLAQILSSYRKGQTIDVIPNAIPWRFFIPKTKNNRKVTVSWHGGVSHVSDVDLIKHLPALNKDYRFVSFGSLRIQGWEHVPTVPFKHFYDTLHLIDADVALMPLNHNDFNNGRSNVKWVENTAVGAACVCTNFGPYAELADPDNNKRSNYVVYPRENDNVESWSKAIKEALDRKESIVQESELLVRDKYNIRRSAWELGEAIIRGLQRF
jgi:hypothetical protein